MSDEYHEGLGRQVSDDERKLLREVLIRADSGPHEYIRTTDAGEQAGLHETRARQLVRTWENDGVVTTPGNVNLLKLTEFGWRVADDITEM